MYISIQYLRGFAAIFVLLSHISFKLETHSFNFLNGFYIGSYGVDLFFIISGFIMCLTVDNKKSTFVQFMKARFVRIIPLYWILSIVALFIFIIKPSLINSSGGNTSILGSFTLLPNGDKYLINNGWTLSYEFFFYFIFAFFIPFKAWQKYLTSIVLLFLSVCGFLIDITNSYIIFMTSPLLLEFVMGIFCYKIIKQNLIKPTFSFLLFFVSIGLLTYVNLLDSKEYFLGRALYAGLPMMLLFLAVVSFEKKIPNNKFLFNIGMSSYSLYLLHPFVLSGVTVGFKFLGLMDYEYIYFLSMLFISLISAWLCYKLIELPVDKKIRNYLYSRV
ncbi:MAG: acyltransferase [Hellea sp.]